MKALRRVWEGWKEIAAYIGDFQSRLLLTVFYFTIALPFGLITRLVDPLELRWSRAAGWTTRRTMSEDLQAARRQF